MSGHDETTTTTASSGLEVLWMGVLGLVILWFFALIFRGPAIEQELAGTVRDRLESAGFKRIQVEARGRDVDLSGAVSGESGRNRARALARDVDGVRVVRDRMRLSVIRLPWLRMSRNGDGAWNVEGVMPDNAAWERVSMVLEKRLPALHTLQRRTDPEVADAAWVGDIEKLLEWVSEVERGGLEIGAGVLEVDGILSDISRHAVLETALNRFVESSGLRLVNRLALLPPRPGQTPEKSAN